MAVLVIAVAAAGGPIPPGIRGASVKGELALADELIARHSLVPRSAVIVANANEAAVYAFAFGVRSSSSMPLDADPKTVLWSVRQMPGDLADGSMILLAAHDDGTADVLVPDATLRKTLAAARDAERAQLLRLNPQLAAQ